MSTTRERRRRKDVHQDLSFSLPIVSGRWGEKGEPRTWLWLLQSLWGEHGAQIKKRTVVPARLKKALGREKIPRRPKNEHNIRASRTAKSHECLRKAEYRCCGMGNGLQEANLPTRATLWGERFLS